jgi:DNA-binding FadR family transcriptional regulator
MSTRQGAGAPHPGKRSSTDGTGEVGAAALRAHPGRHGGSLAAGVAAAIEREIVTLGWPVGQVIASEAELLARHRVSRPVLRQAVGILESHQVARMRRGRNGGLVVTAPSETTIANGVALYLEYRRLGAVGITEARAALELACVELATRRLDEAGVVQLRGLVDTELERFTEDPAAHMALHAAIARMSGNVVLGLFVDVLITLSHERFFGGHRPSPAAFRDADRTNRVHRRIVDAMVAGDVALAQHRMRSHLHDIARGGAGRLEPPTIDPSAGPAATPARSPAHRQ